MKDYREKELKMYIIACILLLICLTKKYSLNMEVGNMVLTITPIIETTLISGVICIFVFISDSLFPSIAKDKIISLFGLIKKPGYTIFSEIEKNNKDDRFITEDVKEKYKNIYDNMPQDKKILYKYQNKCWYEIYSKNRNEDVIYNSNRDYLLCRDIFFATIFMFFIYGCSIMLKFFSFNWIFMVFMVVMLIINYFTTMFKAKRLVYNVIAFDLTNMDKNEET